MPDQNLLSPLIQATILADSVSEAGVRLTTMELVYPRFIRRKMSFEPDCTGR